MSIPGSWRVRMKIGTPSWGSPPQPPAGSNVPRPATTAPVDMNSSTILPLTLPERRTFSRPPSVMSHWCSRCPPSPRPLPGPSFGPAMNPSRDIDMYRTVADTAAPFGRARDPVTYNRMVVDELTTVQVDRLFHALADATRRDILRRCLQGEPSVSR